MKDAVIGIDIGGSHITACVVNIHDKQVLQHTYVRDHIDPSQSPENIIEAWAKIISDCGNKHQEKMEHIGIAMPGPFDYEKGISYIQGLHKYESLYGLNVKALLAEALHISTEHIRMMNDASAFLAGEANAGAGKNCNHLVGLTLGTGLGSSIYDGEKFEDCELWRFPFRESRAEEYVLSRWFVSTHRNRTKETVTGVKELAVKAETDEKVMEMFKAFGATLGEVLVSRFHQSFPEKIVIGGNIANAWDLFINESRQWLQKHGHNCTLVKATLGEQAALIGAACLWLKD